MDGKTWVEALLGDDLVAFRARVRPADVVFVKGIIEASDGLGAVFAEPRRAHSDSFHDGGAIVIAAPRSRVEELEEMIRDLRAELGVFEVVKSEESDAACAARVDPLAFTAMRTCPEVRSAHATPSDPVTTESSESPDPRLLRVWCAFLDRLATDAEAALAVAMAYRELDALARDVWISALDQDADRVTVPRIAVYAPLLAVETEPTRRQRLLAALGPEQAHARPKTPAFALTGRDQTGGCITAIVAPLYLEFIQVLACSFRIGEGFDWVRHDPIVEQRHAPRAGHPLCGVVLEAVPLRSAVDDLAITIVAHTRSGQPLPDALTAFADLFGPSGEAPSQLAIPG